MPKSKGLNWLSRFKQWMLYSFILLIILITIALFGIITYTSDSARDNSRRVFESSLWNALQLQVQTYRFLNFLISLEARPSQFRDSIFAEYSLLMSRIDLLRDGDVGNLVREFEGGRTTRLLNIINGELELLSFHVSRVEEGDLSYLPNLISRIEKLDPQLGEFVSLVNTGSNKFITSQHKALQDKLYYIQFLSVSLLLCLLCLCFFIAKSFSQLRFANGRNTQLKLDIQTAHDDKANMLSFISQEVRPPINTILGTVKTLRQSTNEVSEALTKHIEESSHQLLHTIEMLTDLTLVEAKKLQLNISEGSLRQHMRSCLSLIETQMARKQLASILYIDTALPDNIHLDFERFKVILLGLMQNAIAHSPSGSISIQLRPSALAAPTLLLPDGTHETQVMQLAIRDTGVGMSQALQQNLRRNPNLPTPQMAPDANQVGLNLTLSHQLIYLMKGEMHFSCAENQGCEFWVDLPFYVSSNPTEQIKNTRQQATGKRVLILEQDKNLSRVLELMMTSQNLSVQLHQDETPLPQETFDLIILGNAAAFTDDLLSALEEWKRNGAQLCCYYTQVINSSSLAYLPLSYPLTQEQFDPIIDNLGSGEGNQ
ncbi:HAMP domain-containing sensor histidine kinase [Marinomonas sp. THO17]|uniref:sensor histidine kinase n=1 Tax=Marinomonas sp. THO17 TaxID=3149048 RepID=UPI00336C0D4A